MQYVPPSKNGFRYLGLCLVCIGNPIVRIYPHRLHRPCNNTFSAPPLASVIEIDSRVQSNEPDQSAHRPDRSSGESAEDMNPYAGVKYEDQPAQKQEEVSRCTLWRACIREVDLATRLEIVS